jgi:hypothetical protein
MHSIFRSVKSILRAFPFVVAFIISGCGGGGGSSSAHTISGTAAAGAPIIGYVSVRDSSINSQPVLSNIPIAADGSYTVNVTGLTPPFAFLATGTVGGTTVSYYSAATSADVGGTINITPFTNLMLMNIAGGIVSNYLSNGGLASLTPAQLNAQTTALTAALAPALQAMGLSAATDLLRATFNANNTGLDAFMDAVQVNATNPSAVTITNIMNAATTLVVDTTAGTPTTPAPITGTLPITGLATGGATPTQLILQDFNTLTSLFATSLPDSSNSTLLSIFDNSGSFLQDGQGLSAFLTNITTDRSNIGISFANVTITSIDLTSGVAYVQFSPVSPLNNNNDIQNWKIEKVNGSWLAEGDQRIAHVKVTTTANQNICTGTLGGNCSGNPTYTTGLNLTIDNKGQQPIGSAVVTGPGLPGGGVTLVNQFSTQNNDTNTWFAITTTDALNPACNNGGGNNCGNNNWNMSDTSIGQISPGSAYTVMIYDTSGTNLVETDYITLPVAPILNTALPQTTFPSINSGMLSLNGVNTDTTLTLGWTIPTGFSWNDVNVNVWQNGNGGQSEYVSANSPTTAALTGTSTLIVTAPTSGQWSYANYWISVNDQYGGQIITNYF